MRKIWFGLVVVVVFFLSGCDKPAGDSVSNADVSKNVASRSGTVKARSAQSAKLTITPVPPTADDCLVVMGSGAGEKGYLWQINGFQVSDQTGNTLCGGFTAGDEVQVTTGGNQAAATASVTIANAPPRITEVTANVDAIADHADLVIGVEAIDADQDYIELTYQWYINGEPDPLLTGNTLPASRYQRGDTISFAVVPSDGFTDGEVYRSAVLTIPNAPPRIVSSLPDHFESLEYNYHCQAIDPDGDTLVYALEKFPSGMTIDAASGLVVWSLAGVKGGDYPVRVVASDPEGAVAFQEYTLTIGVPQ